MALRRQILLLTALLGVNSFPVTEAFAYQARAAQAHLERGLRLAHEGNLEAAESELRQAVASAPADSEALTTLGTVLAMRHKLEESTEIFRRTLKINPTDLAARRYLAANLWQLHLYPEAKENLRFILARQPNDPRSRLLLGMVSENSGDYATGARMLESAPEEVKKEPQSIAALARSYYHLGETEKARDTLAQLLPAGPSAVFLGGQIADEMRDYGTAEKIFKSIRGTFSNRAELEYNLGLVAYHSGLYSQGEQILQELLASGVKAPATLNLLAWCYQKQGQSTEAVAAIEEAIELAPSEVPNYLDETKLLLAQHSLPAALQSARRTTNAFPDSANAFELQGAVEREMGQFNDAIRSLNKAVQLDASRPEGWLGLAQAQSAAGLSQEAEASFEASVKRFPKNPQFKVEYAELLLKQADTGEAKSQAMAEQLLRAALAIDPSLADAHYQLGNLALKSGKLTEAQLHLEQCVKLDPSNGQMHFALARLYRRLGRGKDAGSQMERYEKLKATASDPSK